MIHFMKLLELEIIYWVYHIVVYIKIECITQWHIMMVISSENDLEYVGYTNCIEYLSKIFGKSHVN